MEISREVLVHHALVFFMYTYVLQKELQLTQNLDWTVPDCLITVYTEVICKVLISEINALQSNKYLMLPSAIFRLVTNPAR